jgi:hypothetical protein
MENSDDGHLARADDIIDGIGPMDGGAQTGRQVFARRAGIGNVSLWFMWASIAATSRVAAASDASVAR